MTLSAHDRDDQTGEFMPAEEIGIELSLQHLHRQVFDRARLAISAIVEEGVERAASSGRHIGDEAADAAEIGVIHQKGLYAGALKGRAILFMPDGGKDAPAFFTKCTGAKCTDACGTAGDENRFARCHGGFLYKLICISHIREGDATRWPRFAKLSASPQKKTGVRCGYLGS